MSKKNMMLAVLMAKSYTDKKVEEIPVAFKPKGAIDFVDLPALPTESEIGSIWNINDSFTTDNRFLEGSGISVAAHTNVSVVEHDGRYYYDLFSMVDLSNYLPMDNTEEFIPEEDYNPATKKYVDDSFLGLEEEITQLEEDIPGQISELDNDLGFQTASDVNNLIGSHHTVIYAESETTTEGQKIPVLTQEQVLSAYNSLATGDKVVIVSKDRDLYLEVIEANYIGLDELTVSVLYKNSMIITYDVDGDITHKNLLSGEVVEISREYAFSLGDHGYSREWTPNIQGKVWAECGVLETTSNTGDKDITLPVTFEGTNYYVTVTSREMGNFHVMAYPKANNKVSIRATDINGNKMAISVSIEARGWKR